MYVCMYVLRLPWLREPVAVGARALCSGSGPQCHENYSSGYY